MNPRRGGGDQPAVVNTAFKILGVLAGIVILTAGIAVAFMGYFEYPGGMRSDYRARDHDPRLTRLAREADPLIAAVGRFYAAHRRCPRIDTTDLAELRGTGGFEAAIQGRYIIFSAPDPAGQWLYSVSGADAASCRLWRKLGWDPALIWLRDGGKTRWIFAPGDGSAEIPIELDGG